MSLANAAGRAAHIDALIATGLLDTPAERRFDRLTRLAAAALHVPVSLISLVDVERQFFKSEVGLPSPWAEQRETPLTHSFCRHVVETKAPLVVHDSVNHPLVCDNPAITDLGVAAYLGLPVADAGGVVIGSLCVIEHSPRRWSEADLNVLADLAFLVQRELAEKSAADGVAADEKTWRDILNAVPLLMFLADAEGAPIGYNNRWHDFTGPAPVAAATAAVDWLAYCHPADRALAEAGWRRTQAAGLPWQAELRLQHASGTHRLVTLDAFPLRQDNGDIRLWVGSCADIDADRALQVQAEETKRLLAKLLIDNLSAQASWADKAKFRELRGLISAVREVAGVTE